MKKNSILSESYANILRTLNKIQNLYNKNINTDELNELNKKLMSGNMFGATEVKHSELYERLATNDFTNYIANIEREIRRNSEIDLEKSIILSDIIKTLELDTTTGEIYELGRAFKNPNNFEVLRDSVKYNHIGKHEALVYLSSMRTVYNHTRREFQQMNPKTFVKAGLILLAVEQLSMFDEVLK